jgi:hypothetical protein
MNIDKRSQHQLLLKNIEQLKIDKDEKEDNVKQSFSNLVDSLNPFSIAKNSLHQFITDDDVRSDLASSGLQLGFTLISNKLFGKYNSTKGFLGAVISENIFEGIIKQNIPTIILAFNKFFFSESKLKN